ncbi:pyruvate, water dikinase [Fusarium oxysporum f. sp. lycopersici 4287]|uniref:pyruvate, water dikinase n=1 Tax=Fusarium oxysporum f. sp. lycopersici (strain 4287 / CBS 123668 / FGSC 9935 / NRRL 34936) TaxID=426428 RepID=A0A0J9WV56_FUSO4|nr:pyruvate, water dikinase [Fusarium oxysporum f. sp. lycopersici 4287]KNB18947.1 pyruvate, water dikinase [Fusarium oxysporum f. sp. lycopersici 4287]
MIRALGPKGIPVPPGFATSSYAYWHYVDANNIRGKIDELVSQWQAGHQTLAEAGHAIRNLFLRGTWPADTAEAILSGYRDLCDKAQVDNLSVAVRSSATAEDLPDASFAGQQETYLNVQGDDALLDACRRCYASLFTDRAISYRQIKEFSHASVALSIGVQQMVRSDIGGSGVMFSIDTESGFDKIVLINAAWGLGENVVQGTVNPDEYQVFKPLLANMNLTLILSKKLGDKSIKMTYKVGERGHTLTTGLSIGDKAVSGRTCLLTSVSDMDKFIDGSILVTEATDPDWVPVMKRAAAIITDQGGRTSHAAIVSRELGVPAVVGTGNATYVLHTGQDVTVSCAEGDSGLVYDGISEITTQMVHISELPSVRTKIMLNLANPAAAYRWWRIPVDGIGLARMEFVVSNAIQVHPMALIHFEHLKDEQAKREIDKLTTGYAYKPDYFVDKLASGLATLCSAVYPKPAIIRMSDFKTNEYARLIGGAEFELKEENPMIGFRGASRYYSPRYKEGFALECRAVKRVREEMGLTNAIVMIPFCRTIKEARKVLDVMEENGLKRGENGLKVYVMCEIPSNVILASSFTKHFDGFSIGSNDLAQLTLGVDRDSRELASLFNEQDEAVKWMIARAIEVARREGCKIGLCGEAPSNHPEFAKFLVDAGIDSISVSPDSFVQVMKHVVASERGS